MPALGPAPAHHVGGGDGDGLWPVHGRSPRTREARDEGEALLRDRLTRLLADTGTAESVRVDAVEQDGWLTVTLRAECLEEIGREVPLTKE